MGAEPVMSVPADADGSWRIAAPHGAAAQGLVASPFAHLPEACALLLELPPGCSGAWIAKLRAHCPVTNATGPANPALAIAFTWTGLARMGLDAATLATFAPPFVEGMHQIDRQRRLSDTAKSGTTIAGGAQWSGNTPTLPLPATAASAFDAPEDDGGSDAPTPITVHAIVLLYAADTTALATLVQSVEPVLQDTCATISHRFDLSLRFDGQGRAREHFGFSDGISQPVPHGAAIVTPAGAKAPIDPVNGIAAGDILMGHCNAQAEPAPGPIVSKALDPAGRLSPDSAPEGFHNLGIDGSYLVVRELRQDVASFWNSMFSEMGANATVDQANWLAARVVGRTMDGDMLVPGGVLPRAGADPANDFLFFKTDPHGMGCPIGSHVRRANPRDGLAPDAATAPDLLAASRNHRILRRGRKFGPTIADPRVDDGVSRGLLFMCLNTDLTRQFEFVQQTWLLNANFGTLLEETDPLLGPAGRFSVPATPLRFRPTVQTYIRFAGGEYFFLPSLPALDYLQTLPISPAVP